MYAFLSENDIPSSTFQIHFNYIPKQKYIYKMSVEIYAEYKFLNQSKV